MEYWIIKSVILKYSVIDIVPIKYLHLLIHSIVIKLLIVFKLDISNIIQCCST